MRARPQPAVTAVIAVIVAGLSSCNDWSSLSTTYNGGVCAAFVVAGDTYTCVRKTDGSVHCWGDNRFGQLGTGDTKSRPLPTKVEIPGVGVVKVFLPMGDGDLSSDVAVFTCAITTDSAMWCWGDNRNGQLGTGDTNPRLSPTPVTMLASNNAKGGNGGGFMCTQSADGAVSCWGKNQAGQLGTGDTKDRSTPAAVTLPMPIDRMATGAAHTCARGSDGSLYCWGSNAYGQLGIGSMTSTSKPALVSDLGPRVVRLGAGAGHTCAYTTDGLVWCWGDNREGQLGTGDNVAHDKPIMIDAQKLSDVNQIYAGANHSCAVKTDGTLWCWGGNQFGQLGTGDMDARTSPTQIAPSVLGSSVATAYAGGGHTCAIKTDGSLWCWGNNAYGQITPTAGTTALEPVQVLSGCQ
jgi:alpha-tubulin suppressor-like RCC1 family protein